MISLRHLSFATVFALTGGTLIAADVDDLLAKLHVEVEKAVTESKTARGGSSLGYGVDGFMARIDTALTRDNFEEADQALTQLASTRLSPESKELISQLQRELPHLAEERQKALAAQIATALEKAAKACLEAKTERDLEPSISELSALKKNRGDYGGADSRNRLNTRLEGAIHFLTRWQEYFLQRSRGYDATAKSILRELADPAFSGNQYYPVLSRPDVLARLGQEKEIAPEEILRTVKNLDDLPKALVDLRKAAEAARLSRAGVGSMDLSAYELTELQQIYKGTSPFRRARTPLPCRAPPCRWASPLRGLPRRCG